MGATLGKGKDLPGSPESSTHRRDPSVHRSYEGSIHSIRDRDPVILQMLESLMQPEEEQDEEYERDVAQIGELVTSHGIVHNPLATELAHAHQEERRNLPAFELENGQPKRTAGSFPSGGQILSANPEGPTIDESRRASQPSWHEKSVLQHLVDYFGRMRGGVEKPAPFAPPLDIVLGFIGAFTSIFAIAALKQWSTPHSHFDFLVASFGASAVLVFGVPEGKLSQPRNLVGGQVLSAAIGCAVRLALKDVIYVSSALGMALSLTAMQFTKTLHPPGGATALIAASASNPLAKGAGFSIVLVVFIDACIMLVIGLLVNNAQPHKRYPTFWF